MEMLMTALETPRLSDGVLPNACVLAPTTLATDISAMISEN